MSDLSDQVVIVGGGVIGAATAYYLACEGRAVSILEADRFAAGCSHANCGFISPSHVLPLSVPGAVAKTFKAMFKPDSPFYIKPRFDPALWGWLWRFARRCNTADMLKAGKARKALLESSKSLYLKLLDDESIECEFEQKGNLFVFKTEKAFEDYAKTDQVMRDHFNVGAKRLNAEQMRAMEPTLKSELAGGWWYEQDMHLRPDMLMGAWRQVLEAKGVQIHEQVRVDHLDIQHGQIRGVRAGDRSFHGNEVVLATGAMAPHLAKQIPLHLPIQPGKGYSITTERPAPCPSVPMIFQEHKVAVTPMQSGYRLGSTMEFAGYDTQIDPKRIGLLEKGASHYLDVALGKTISEKWYGWRPMSHDGIPTIGSVPKVPNLFIAAGHSMLGLSMATGTGKLLCELIQGQNTHLDADPYAPARLG